LRHGRARLTPWATLAVVAAMAAPGLAAPAAAQAPCDLVKDPAGDAHMWALPSDPPGSGPQSLDVVSGDVASNARFLTVAVRVKDLQALDVLGDAHDYQFLFSTRRNTFELQAQLPAHGPPRYEAYVGPPSFTPTGDPQDQTYNGTGIGPAHGAIDPRHDEIRMTVKVKALAAAGDFAGPLRRLQIFTWRDTQTPQAQGGYNEDVAIGDRQYGDRYELGGPSCLAVGHF
jgi:hypothetical protein